MFDFPAYREYGVPNPPAAVARIVEGPLREALIPVFDELLTAAFQLGRFESSDEWAALPESAARKVDEALTEVGVALLGDRDLVSDVSCACGDADGVGDVLAALVDLYEYGSVELGPAMVAQLRRAGHRLPERSGE